jgi:hypothetical protein
MTGYFPNVTHGAHAQEYASLASTVEYEKVLEHFGATGYWTAHLDGKEIGYVEECDRDEDRIYYDYCVLRELWIQYKEETAKGTNQ